MVARVQNEIRSRAWIANLKSCSGIFDSELACAPILPMVALVSAIVMPADELHAPPQNVIHNSHCCSSFHGLWSESELRLVSRPEVIQVHA